MIRDYILIMWTFRAIWGTIALVLLVFGFLWLMHKVITAPVVSEEEVCIPTVETREEFIRRYCANSRMTWDEMRRWKAVCRCHCDDREGDHWAMVPNTEELLEDYLPGGFYHQDGDPEPFTGPLDQA